MGELPLKSRTIRPASFLKKRRRPAQATGPCIAKALKQRIQQGGSSAESRGRQARHLHIWLQQGSKKRSIISGEEQ
jgi:hypothetical protein